MRTINRVRRAALYAALFVACLSTLISRPAPAQTGTWSTLATPNFAAYPTLQLTDGTILAQDGSTTNWWRLTPDALGNYVNGTWAQLAPMANTRYFYPGAVLADGRVIVIGGEFSSAGSDTADIQIYDPLTNTWTTVPPPAGWSNIGDAPCKVLADGRVMIGSIFDLRTAIYNPVSNQWTAAASMLSSAATGTEMSWALLPDKTVLAINCNGTINQAQRYIPSLDTWVNSGSAPSLVQASTSEIGPFVMLPSGKSFCLGATGNTGVYTPPANLTDPGTWLAGPTFPVVAGYNGDPSGPMQAKDSPSALMPNGRVLCSVAPPSINDYGSPTSFYEYDPALGTLTQAPNPQNNFGQLFLGRMLVAPTGQVFYSADNATVSGGIQVYTPGGPAPSASWKPVISALTLNADGSYHLTGTQFNGLSEGATYGDDSASSTNYPIVRIQNTSNNKIWYARTFNHSTMALATGATTVSTNFQLPAGLDSGPFSLYIVANGIASDPLAFTPVPTSGAVSIHSGGGTAGIFVADTDFSGGTAAQNNTGLVDMSAAANPAPMAVYTTERYGAMSYTVPNLVANASYTVRLHFTEDFFTASGQRKFNVTINSAPVLTNFDIYATAGAIHKANIQQFTATASSIGQIAIAFANVTNNAKVDAIEVLPTSILGPASVTATPGNAQVALSWSTAPRAYNYQVKRSTVTGGPYTTVTTTAATSYTNTGLTNGTTYYYVIGSVGYGESANSTQVSAIPSGGVSTKINAGGPAVSPFIADTDFSGGTTATNWTGAINTSAVTNPAPQAVYQSERYGAMTYTIPGYVANSSHTVRLHFCENYFTTSGQRKFNVAINSTSELSNFDIWATAGATHKANIQQFTLNANSSGQYVIVFTNVTNNALINGIEVQ